MNFRVLFFFICLVTFQTFKDGITFITCSSCTNVRPNNSSKSFICPAYMNTMLPPAEVIKRMFTYFPFIMGRVCVHVYYSLIQRYEVTFLRFINFFLSYINYLLCFSIIRYVWTPWGPRLWGSPWRRSPVDYLESGGHGHRDVLGACPSSPQGLLVVLPGFVWNNYWLSLALRCYSITVDRISIIN